MEISNNPIPDFPPIADSIELFGNHLEALVTETDARWGGLLIATTASHYQFGAEAGAWSRSPRTRARLTATLLKAQAGPQFGTLKVGRNELPYAGILIGPADGERLGCVLADPQAGAFDIPVVEAALARMADILALLRERNAAMADRYLLETAIDSVPHLIWVMGNDQRYIFQNKADRDAFQDMRGRSMAETDLPKSMVTEWSEMHRTALAGRQYHYSSRKVTKAGEIIAENYIAPVRANGKVQAIVGHSIDHTARFAAETAQKEAMEALKSSKILLGEIAEMSQVGGWELDLTNNTLNWTDETRRIHEVDPGFSPEVERAIEFYTPDSRPEITEAVQRAIETGEGWDGEYSITTAKGATVFVRVIGRAVKINNTVTRLVGAIQDITAIRNTRLELTSARDEARRALSNLSAYQAALEKHALVSITDRRGSITFANDKFCKISGYTREELIGSSHAIINSGHHPKEFFTLMWRTIATGGSWHGEVCNRAKDGGLYWVDTTIVPVKGADGKIDQYVSIRYDITERKRAEEALEDELERRERAETLLRDVMEAVPDAVVAFDPDDRLVLFNSAYQDYYERAAPMIKIGSSFEDIIRYGVTHGQNTDAGETDEEQEAWIQDRLNHFSNPSGPTIQPLAGGRWMQVRECRTPNGYTVGVRTEVTALKKAEAKLKRLAERDALTRLANRDVLLKRLKSELAARRKGDTNALGALLLLDMDHFKDINDTLGHDVGDAVLKKVATRLEHFTRKSDLVGRLGGDEYAAVLSNVSSEQECAATLTRLLERLSKPMRVNGHHITPKFSLGATLFPRDGTTESVLFKNADIALYEAKRHGRDQWCFFDPTLREQLEVRQDTIGRLQQAVASDAITIALQPKIALDDGSHAGFEALARWQHEGQIISPAEFIPVAEETGLIIPVGKAVLDKALRAVSAARKAGFEPGRVAVNIAAAQLKEEGFADHVLAVLASHGLTPEQLELEITETVLLDRSSCRIEETLIALHRMGIALTLDDFGTGYASLTYLKRFPVDSIKIDRSFVRDIETDPDDAAIVRAIVNLAHSLGMGVVAEGVETEEQKAFLRQQQCDFAQGFGLARPMPVSAVQEYLSKAIMPRLSSDTVSVDELRDRLTRAFSAR